MFALCYQVEESAFEAIRVQVKKLSLADWARSAFINVFTPEFVTVLWWWEEVILTHCAARPDAACFIEFLLVLVSDLMDTTCSFHVFVRMK